MANFYRRTVDVMGDWRVYDIMIDTGAVACGTGRPEGWYQRYFLVPPARGCGVLQSACQYVCLSVSAHISQKPHIQTNKFSAGPASCAHVSLLWRRQCNALCSRKTSNFVSWMTLSKINRFLHDFGYVKSWENLTWTSYRFVHLTVRSHFQQWSYSKNEKVSVFGTRCTSSFVDDVVFARVLKESNVKPYTSLLCLEYCVINWY